MCDNLVVFKRHKAPPDMAEYINQKLIVEEGGSMSLATKPLLDKNTLIISKSDVQGLLVLQLLDFILVCRFEGSALDSTESRQSLNCACKEIFGIIQRILRSGGFEFYSVIKCRDKAFVSEESGARSIGTEDFARLTDLVRELCSCRETCTRILRETGIPDERVSVGTVSAGTGYGLSGPSWITQANDTRAKYREIVRQFRIVEEKLGITQTSAISDVAGTSMTDVAESREDGDRPISPASETIVGTSEGGAEAVAASPSDIRASLKPSDGPAARVTFPSTYPFASLLSVFANRLVAVDWDQVRFVLMNRLPESAEVLSAIPNGVDVFHELANQNLVSEGNWSFLKDVFYDVGRVDLVHLVDCISEGDYNLLISSQAETQTRPQYNAPYVNESITGVPIQEMQTLSVQSRQAGLETSDLTSTRADHGTEDTTPDESQSTGNDQTPEVRRNLGGSSEVPSSWNKNPAFACEHYDRYCDVQFECCEVFWPCHRCHNAKSRCRNNKLRSRDIKMIRCKRCATVQQFPKESPNCVHCNLKFANYFCPLCQHLTGLQNHPYHCSKCGICRVHGDRSFHCDVCGVCLDVNLRGNHKCRAGSAHDECCICFELSNETTKASLRETYETLNVPTLHAKVLLANLRVL